MLRQGFGRRFLAGLIDGVIVAVVVTVVTLLLPLRIAAIVGALIGLAYGAMEIVKAQTVGKMLLGMKITRQDGSPADPTMLLTRYAVKYSPSVFGLLYAVVTVAPLHWLQMVAALVVFVGCFLMLRPDKLALHDILAKTAVVGGEGMPAAFSVIMTPAPVTETATAAS